MRLTVRVPATSANLGPGFDCFGLALDLWNEFVVDTEDVPGVAWEGEGAKELPRDGSDLVSRVMATVAQALGGSLPPLAVRGLNRIPIQRGLGSSSAATVAGVALALRLLSADATSESVFAHAAQIEGHPDNAAPAVYGGFTIAMPDGSVVRFDPHPGLRPVVLVPEVRLPTSEARAALSATVPREDAVFTAAHAALTIEALTHNPSLLLVALQDRLHQDVRLALVPTVLEAFGRIRDAGVPVCVSGAGPSLLAFPDGPLETPAGWRRIDLAVSPRGVELVEA